jgi:hypothetical protein
MSDILKKAIQSAVDGNPAAFREAIGDALLDKIGDAVEIEKHRIAGSFMSDVVEEEVDLDEKVEIEIDDEDEDEEEENGKKKKKKDDEEGDEEEMKDESYGKKKG